MKYHQCVLPERCTNCGSVFDLWYDLVNKTDQQQRRENLELYNSEFLCWQCRKIRGDEEAELVIEIEPFDELTENTTDEVFLE